MYIYMYMHVLVYTYIYWHTPSVAMFVTLHCMPDQGDLRKSQAEIPRVTAQRSRRFARAT